MNKILLVTGANSDLSIAYLEQEDVNQFCKIIALVNSNHSKIDSLKELYPDVVEIYKCNLLLEEEVRATAQSIVDKYNITHYLHTACQKVEQERFRKTEARHYRDFFETQVVSNTILLKNILPIMAKQKFGNIVFILSSYILSPPPIGVAPYTIAKHALLGLMQSISSEYSSKGIRVNAVSPSMIKTEFISDIPEIAQELAASARESKKLLHPSEVASKIKYLLSDISKDENLTNIPIT